MSLPPSTTRTWPGTKNVNPTTYTTLCATSSGLPSRSSSVALRIRSAAASLKSSGSMTGPGAIALTAISGASSSASAFVIVTMPPLEITYGR